MNLCPSLITWIMNYLTSRPQYVRLRPSTLSDVIITNTGAPQATVLSPFLFSLYASDCRATHNNCFIDKYADDTVLTRTILNDNFINYTQEVMSFVDRCDSNHLVINVTKTTEMVIDFRKQTKVPDLIGIKENDVERVETFKYLGIELDNKLTWKQNTYSIVKKTKPCLHCLRKLRTFNVHNTLLQLFYTSIIRSTLTFGLACWGDNLLKHDRDKLNRIIKTASMIIGKEQEDIGTIHEYKTLSKLKKILNDKTHPFNHIYNRELSAGRLRLPRIRTNRNMTMLQKTTGHSMT